MFYVKSTNCKLKTKIKVNSILKLCRRYFSTEDNNKKTIKFFFKYNKGGKIVQVEGDEGQSILDVAHKYKEDLEGACDQSLACSTCHVIFDDKTFKQLGEASEKEDDLLDLAFGLTDTSRLGCQIKLSELLRDKVVIIPAATRNLYVDGHKPEPH